MHLGSRGARHRVVIPAVIVASAWTLLGLMTPAQAATTAAKAPNLAAGSRYLIAPANLIDGHYYQSFAGVADFGLTIDGALALAATGDEDSALRKVVTFMDDEGKDPSGNTVNEWTGIGTSYVSGGAIGKEALLAEVVGDNPRSFGGHNLITALNASVCTRASGTACPAAGSYRNDTSVFDQSLGILAQLRAGQVTEAAKPVAYLESMQAANGSFPSLIPASGGPDVDSTAMAVMALSVAHGSRAATAVASGVTFIASHQERNGGFSSAGAESVNSTGLAIQALTLRAAAYQGRIRAARAFLAGEQNSNGGFNVDAGGPRGSNLRASTQALGGAVGTPFGALRLNPRRTDPATRHRTDPAGHHNSGHQASSNPGQHRLTPHASVRPTARTTVPPSVQSAGAPSRTSRQDPIGLVAQTRASGSLAVEWWLAVAAVVIAITVLILAALQHRAEHRIRS